ncbi:MAG TPA: lactate utilization protein B [Lacipirellulaceae bacterium]|jgi:L-lactate dehydrogenase complex protein LldF|nr:lactate utilization protein B [Lacipirellulaceae bacterium]
MDHPTAAAAFIVDDERVRWHDGSVWFARVKRDRASHGVPEWEVLRDIASGIKLHTMSRLDEYLEQFEANATRLGAQIHWARDASEHNAIVARIVEQHGATRVVKSKSMLTEECGLNPHLEQLGIEVTDTDLGEWIVQLLGQHPSHIVTPAIHIRKEEVGQLFHERLGTAAGATDPSYLAEAARQHLRAKFLAAEVGITGVNFAVAETGGFVVCTNEGNADLGVSLPKVHIACMGIEKLVPRAADLGVFLRLLARSATGQPITSYSSHFHGPRPGGELHIVLVDNHRSDLLGSGDFRRSLNCIRCGACFNTCPVYRRSGGHSYGATVAGPIGSIINAAREPREHKTLPFACSLCGSCSDVCPVKIDLHQQLFISRRQLANVGLVPKSKLAALKITAAILGRPWLYRIAGRAARFVLRVLPKSLIYSRLNVWGRHRDLPPPPRKTFRELYAARQPKKLIEK